MGGANSLLPPPNRKSPLYDNCFLYAPDGQPLCTCDKKKARWYLNKGIGGKPHTCQNAFPNVSPPPPSDVRTFSPSERGSLHREAAVRAVGPSGVAARLLPDRKGEPLRRLRQSRLLHQVGASSAAPPPPRLLPALTRTRSRRKNIVPHEYRRHFPTELKDHNSHDILLLCTSCHAASNVHDGVLKQMLAEEFSAPQGCEEGVRVFEDSDRRRVRSAARALLSSGDGLPEQRKEELQLLIRKFLNMEEEGEELTEEALQEAAGLETRFGPEPSLSQQPRFDGTFPSGSGFHEGLLC